MELPLPRARLLIERLPAVGEIARLSAEEAAHARARRLRRGDQILLLDGSGDEAEALLTRLDRTGAEARVGRVRMAGVQKDAPRITLYVAAVRAERLSWIAEKATELGAFCVTLVRSERTQAFRAAEATIARLERVAREAAKQSESPRWPRIAGPMSFADVIAAERESHRFFFDSQGERIPGRLAQRPTALLIGPEGGWSGGERSAAAAQSWSVIALPAGKLRTETAAIAGLVLARAALTGGNR